MTYNSPSSTVQSIVDEFYSADNELLVTLRGASRLTTVSHGSISDCLKRLGMVGKPHPKGLKAANGKDFTMVGQKEFLAVCRYFAFESVDVTIAVKTRIGELFCAFAERGYVAWVSDVLSLPVDPTNSNAVIDELLAKYPNAANLINEHGDSPDTRFLTVRNWLLQFKGFNHTAASHATRRIGSRASGSYQMLTGKDTREMHYTLVDTDTLGTVKVYSLNDIGILESLYSKYLDDCSADKFRRNLHHNRYLNMACSLTTVS